MSLSGKAFAEDAAVEDLWNLAVALNRAADTIDASVIGWTAIAFPGMPVCSLAFVVEHLMAQLDRIIGGGYRHAE